MPTILTKRSNTPGAIPATANLTNAAGGAELAVNTADKRLFTITSGSQVVELGTNPASLTCADVSATVLRAGSATITNLIATTATVSDLSATVARISSLTISSLSLSNATFGSATITNLTSTSATISSALTLTGGTANGVLYLNASKVATSGSAITFDGTNLGVNGRFVIDGTVASAPANGGMFRLTSNDYTYFAGKSTGGGVVLSNGDGTATIQMLRNSPTSYTVFEAGNGTEQMRLTSTGLGIGTSSPAAKLDIGGNTAATLQAIFGRGVTDSNFTVRYTNGASGSQAFIGSLGLDYANGTWADMATIKFYRNNTAGELAFFASAAAASGTEGMRLNSTGLGIGTSSPVGRLHVVGSSATTTALLERSTASTAVPVFSSRSLATSSGDMADGFGPTHAFAIQDGAAVINPIGEIGAVREGADNSGGLIFRTYSAGTATTQMRLDASGNLGLGVTPSAWYITYRAFQFGGYGSSVFGRSENNSAGIASNSYVDSAGSWKYINSNFASYYQQLNGQHQFHTAASGTAGNAITFTQAMTLDASGNLGIGVTSLSSALSGSAKVLGICDPQSNNLSSVRLSSGSSFSSGNRMEVFSSASTCGLYGQDATPMLFYTNATERARITSGGYSKFSNDGTYISAGGAYHEFKQTANDYSLRISSTNASLTEEVLQVYAERNTTNNTFYAIRYYNSGAAAYKFQVADSGNVTNTNGSYGTISDAKMKTDIVDAGSQWDDLKAVRFRKFKMKDDPQQITQLGVVAQELEQTSPGLVEEHADRDAEGNDLGTTTKSVKTSVLLMKAAVALQEAMARIEKLEAEVAALKGA